MGDIQLKFIFHVTAIQGVMKIAQLFDVKMNMWHTRYAQLDYSFGGLISLYADRKINLTSWDNQKFAYYASRPTRECPGPKICFSI